MAITLAWIALALFLLIAYGILAGIFHIGDRPAYNRVRIDHNGHYRITRHRK